MELNAKLQLKPGQPVESVLAPESVLPSLADTAASATGTVSALLVFVVNRATLEEQRTRIVGAVNEERLTWIAYPKAGQLGTDLNRDTLAALLGESGVQPVRQIAIDDIWSALRFRPRN